MKCPNCGAETSASKNCEYCNSELPQDKPVVNITNNYYEGTNNQNNESNAGKCPKCGSVNIKFQREKIGSVGKSQSHKSAFSNTRNSNSVRQNAYRTIGLCQNCGHTWDPDDDGTSSIKKSWVFWLIAILFWPISLSIWFYKTPKIKLEKKWRIIILAVVWVLLFAISAFSPSEETGGIETTTQNTTVAESVTETSKNIPTDEFSVINTFIEKYNEIATVQMTEGKEIDIHDKEGGYYRTEFRLNAFKDAVAKQCKIGDATIDIINTKSAVSNDNNIRIYLSTESIDIAEEVFDVIARIVYPTLTDAELAEAHEDLRSGNSGNYFKDISFYYIQSYNELFMDNVMFDE